MIVAEYIAKFLKKQGIKDLFMLTGYGAMYLNDAIANEKIKYYATRNEATAPIMAAAYSRLSKSGIGVACVTAGPGATNALPGLAEAYVDSSSIVVISGQVDRKHTTISTKSKKIRTFGTAEINIIPIVKPLTKYAVSLKNENEVRYVLEKAFYEAKNERPGPVWIDVPLDIQNKKINPRKLKFFKPTPKKKDQKKINKDITDVLTLLSKSKRPLIVCGQGVKISNTFKHIYSCSLKNHIPILFTRAAQDLISHNKKNIMGQAGIKGSKYCKKIMTQCDLVISLGCRMAPQFAGHEFEAFKNAKIVMVDIENDELNKKGIKVDKKINNDLKDFVKPFSKKSILYNLPDYKDWCNYCNSLKTEIIEYSKINKNPIDLYYFMDKIGQKSQKNHIMVTDAGSNYYVGGQVWKFQKGQKEVTSITNAAMGLSIPLAIGSAIANKKNQILAVTGDGSLELNIQELKTISHYNLDIKLFVINNGGYVSMHNWADNFFDGRRVDNPDETGEGTLNLKNIANAFDLEHYRIFNYKSVSKDLTKILKSNKPMFIEVMTDNKQKIFDAFKDR